ncbi:MAG: hypothetical protein HYV93_07145 [Candidatus Rokubacteria bacterium]|nr:hypothetical protein [Candidatus Rokubacteria bacterium]
MQALRGGRGVRLPEAGSSRSGRGCLLMCAGVVVALLMAGCVLPPTSPAPPRVDVLGGDARALVYGTTARAVIEHPSLREGVRRLFGPDWAATGAERRVSLPAPDFFGGSEPPRLLRIGGREYVAVPGCVERTCRTHRALLLIAGPTELLARLDDGGLSVHYVHGAGLAPSPEVRALVDAAGRALRP